MTPPNQVRLLMRSGERTFRIGDEPDPPQDSDMPWVEVAVFPIKASILETVRKIRGNQG